ncbi:MAG: Lnb N-terminal periplasmic domain-containing protein [Pirellulaceae bacterium]
MPLWRFALLILMATVAAAGGCASVPQQASKQPAVPPPSLTSLFQPLTGRKPSNEGDWIPELKVLAQASFEQDKVTIQNVRNCEFLTYRDCLVDYYDKTYDLAQIQSVDFIVVPFSDNKAIAHTMLSFGFANGDHVGISVEVRLENGEKYDAARGLLGEYELVYVIADERELILARTEHRNCDVYLYRTTATPEMARKLFTDMLKRANQLREHPEFYDTLSNNCTTNIVEHINKIAPGRVPYDYRVLLPGYADELGYELGLLDNSVPFAELKKRSRINEIAHAFKDEKGAEFSAKIRGEKKQRD